MPGARARSATGPAEATNAAIVTAGTTMSVANSAGRCAVIWCSAEMSSETSLRSASPL